MKILINYIFGCGHRCYSADFLIKYGLRKFSGPFDYMFIDFETSFKVMHNNFNDFLNDIVLFNKQNNITRLLNSKNTNSIDSKIVNLMKEDMIGYMRYNYKNKNLLINQNYLRETQLCGNLYHWEKICIFNHHDLEDTDVYSKIKTRCEQFKYITNTFTLTTALFYITKVVNTTNMVEYINRILVLKKTYNINNYIIMIICSDNIDETHCFINNCLFIIKKVEPYLAQHHKYEYDNDLNDINYDNEINIIRNYFDFDIKEKNEIYRSTL
jgi:Putative papain-like cysteine peptidase (DUF1796)